jgi:hypothetical protein
VVFAQALGRARPEYISALAAPASPRAPARSASTAAWAVPGPPRPVELPQGTRPGDLLPLPKPIRHKCSRLRSAPFSTCTDPIPYRATAHRPAATHAERAGFLHTAPQSGAGRHRDLRPAGTRASQGSRGRRRPRRVGCCPRERPAPARSVSGRARHAVASVAGQRPGGRPRTPMNNSEADGVVVVGVSAGLG